MNNENSLAFFSILYFGKFVEMSKTSQLRLKPSSILKVPFQTYEKDFSFIVNGQEFKTSRFFADLLSPIICKIHLNDPTVDTFVINTQYTGDFSRILQLSNFISTNLSEDEIPFISEVIEILGNESIEHRSLNTTTEITVDNVLTLLQQHNLYSKFYSSQISKEIEFAASHFNELFEKKEEETMNLPIDILMSILKNDHLLLKNEDQLLKFANDMHSKSSIYSILYETVLFLNVSEEMMKEFVMLYNINDISIEIWRNLSKRLYNEKSDSNVKNRYTGSQKKGTVFEYTDEKLLKGIFNYFQEKTGGQIDKEIGFTSSSVASNNESYQPRNVAVFNDKDKFFYSGGQRNDWICFDFREHRVIPTHYTVRSYETHPNNIHPKSWVVEGSEDGKSWVTIDEETNCPLLNGNSLVHTFAVNHPTSEEFKYIRMKSTGQDWNGQYYLLLESFEIYGTLI
ncbi:hypothetical protein M9Y10_026262 [Tritrichomonas musculus]|uniref:F5/8 type C domain-containing protein n=1 Tax=Tritrichomonas musculus TaxID=1915356 RepID=A0ABR2H766_9EUKA